MPHPLPIPPPSVNRRNSVLDSHELHDFVDGVEMTNSGPTVRTSTDRIDQRLAELAGAVALLARQLAELKLRFESMQGD